MRIVVQPLENRRLRIVDLETSKILEIVSPDSDCGFSYSR